MKQLTNTYDIKTNTYDIKDYACFLFTLNLILKTYKHSDLFSNAQILPTRSFLKTHLGLAP